jgi:hypothetical protein
LQYQSKQKLTRVKLGISSSLKIIPAKGAIPINRRLSFFRCLTRVEGCIAVVFSPVSFLVFIQGCFNISSQMVLPCFQACFVSWKLLSCELA